MTPIAMSTGPIPKLEDALDEAKQTHDWFKAIVFSAIELERYGYLKLKNYLSSLNVNSDLTERLIRDKRLFQIAEYLQTIKAIDKNECKTMQEIGEVRNKFVHRKPRSDFLIGTRATKEYEPLLKEAIRILKEKLDAIKIFAFK